MNVIASTEAYLHLIIDHIPGMKALILDKETMGIISMIMSQSEILQKEVFFIELLTNIPEQSLNHLKAIYFIRPTSENIRVLQQQLESPKFEQIHLFFSNILEKHFLSELALSDTYEVIQSVHEYYADLYAINADFFTLNIPTSRFLSENTSLIQRTTSGILSAILSFKSRPKIRFQSSSSLCASIASSIHRTFEELPSLFDHPHTGTKNALLLLVDRREDPVTPLLLQWTYQAMVHELLTIHNNRVQVKKKQVVLSENDAFFKSTMYLNYGDFGVRIKELIEEFSVKVNSHRQISSIDDMRNFVETYSDYLNESGTVSRHVALMTEISHLIDTRSLMRISAVEQSLVCENDKNSVAHVLEIVRDAGILFEDKLRVVMLYALRYETNRTDIATLRGVLRECAMSNTERERVRAVDEVLAYAGEVHRTGDLFTKDWISKAHSFISSGLTGVENIYTQHEPLLLSTLQKLSKSRLKESEFEYKTSTVKGYVPENVFVFLVGGVTFEEAAMVAQWNEANGMKVVLGGTSILNSKAFIDQLLQ